MAGNDRQWQGGNGFQNYSMTSGGGAGAGAGAGGRASPASTPSRPARSVRRPARDVAPLNVKQSSGGGGGGDRGDRGASSNQLEPPRMRHANSNDSSASGSRAARLAQAIQRDEREREAANGYRPGSSLSFRSASPDADEADFFGGEPLIVPTASTSKVSREDGSPVLAKAVAAFSSAGQAKNSRTQQAAAASSGAAAKKAARDRAGTNASSRSAGSDGRAGATDNGAGPRSRRGAVGVQGESARRRATQHPQPGVPSTPAFREMERVLALVATEWPELLPPPLDEDAGEEEEEDVFDPVTLALSLVNEEGSTARFDSFMAAKQALSRSLQSSIQTHYRAFDASASSYNGLVLNLTHAQKNTTDLRKVLEEVRETLGKRRTDLAVLEARRTELAEMDRILVTIDTLKSIPDRLETLLGDKQFLQAASLLMRSLRMINRSDMLEISATADLRAYFVSQENLMFEYLTEELHNHLYLKSLYTESRWKAHTPQQMDLPIVYVEHSTRSIFDAGSTDLTVNTDDASKRRPTRLSAFLTQLAQKPPFVRNIDETIDESFIQEASGPSTHADTQGEASGAGTMPKSGSLASIQSAIGNAQSVNGAGHNGHMNGSERSKANPEQDSFTYIESILESLAYLGKLGVALDGVLQRNPLEIYNLVENTAIEVDDRNDPIRRSSLRIAGIGSSSKFLLNGAFPSQNSTAYSFLLRSSMSSTSLSLDDASATSGIIDMNTEILLDFFWTLFSKLDAVLQGFRVFHEVVQRIVKSRDFAESALVSKSGGLLFTLNDIWRPIQFEVQALLHDYLIDEQSDGMSSRSAIASVNDVLRQGRLVRDPRKSLFKFGESDSKATSRRIRPYEDSLNKALKTSVPGLVSSLAEGNSAGIGLSTTSAAFSSNLDNFNNAGTNGSGSGNIVGRTHRMLVPPNGFKIDCLALPALKFLERTKICLNEGDGSEATSVDIAKRCSGLMDEATLERLRPALSEHVKLTATGNNGSGSNSLQHNMDNDNNSSRMLTNGNNATTENSIVAH